LKQQQVAALHVSAGIDGVLQQIGDLQMLQIGQRVTPSATLAKVVQPSRLKAELKVGEIQAKDLQLGQPCSFPAASRGLIQLWSMPRAPWK
jgi:multidrug resistance efflux pump